MTAPATTPTTPATAKKPRTPAAPVSPEFLAMRRIENALAPLGSGGRQRVLAYFAQRTVEESNQENMQNLRKIGTPEMGLRSSAASGIAEQARESTR